LRAQQESGVFRRVIFVLGTVVFCAHGSGWSFGGMSHQMVIFRRLLQCGQLGRMSRIIGDGGRIPILTSIGSPSALISSLACGSYFGSPMRFPQHGQSVDFTSRWTRIVF
jgi:hypothetical protein